MPGVPGEKTHIAFDFSLRRSQEPTGSYPPKERQLHRSQKVYCALSEARKCF
ncbi:hypothetical protein GGP62_000933 [Salinibacter ruber]|uniref:Uncharacterized protein n=1 Tax=Salinibacter ruber TaxID=146919 RepID=A0A9X2QEC1_9BACT|nr:hypothetical protein [Salinibacter ruber]MCS3683815.1 hypothetical protein [Salinibacter ruber]MCS3705961.1 hypothetical protein [Salinibacter ruber]MCS3710913.1 hypothetical protein [Salinibacter ruber]MCS3853380.1 hypothetical protein [Salinibacter ruber]